MKSFIKALRRQDGFTLVELMVVVAIIGLLSAVAVPNFKKYQAKAKISEAKLQLSAAYTAEQAFFSDFNMYAGCLEYMGFDPQPEMNARFYAVGFPSGIAAINTNAHNSAIASGMNGTDCPLGAAASGRATATAGASFFLAGKGVGGAIINTQALFATAANAGAAGTCTTNPASGGACVGSQADTTNMTFNIAALGIISGDAATAGTASGLILSNQKVFRTVVQGY
jgi:type IV pilus assembly protein PilA